MSARTYIVRERCNRAEPKLLLDELQVAQPSQRDSSARWVSFGQKWKAIFCKQCRSIFNHCDVVGLQSYRIRWIKAT